MTMKSGSQLEKPWLSVAMPVHCGERWLRDALQSVAAQDCSGIELIILDSTEDDSCRNIATAFMDCLDIRYVHVPNVASWQVKTNLAVDRARAAHVAMLHQDDLWLDNRSADLRSAIADFPEAVLFLNPSYIVDEAGRRLGLWRCPLPPDRLLDGSDVAEHLLVQNFVSIPAPVVQKRAWLACGGMDAELWYTADWDLYLNVLRQGQAIYRGTPSTAFRVHASSLTVSGSRNLPDFERQMQVVLDRHCDLVPGPILPKIKRRAKASIRVNCALAQASSGSAAALAGAVGAVLALGPAQALAYLRDSRVVERTLPRLRARFAGSL
jgi:glycosyltransferase involved in cell wall biosynthesis